MYLFIDPSAITPNSKAATARKDVAQALAFILAGLAGAIGVYFTWRNLDQTRDTTQETLRLTAQGQITERFTSAIDQLGSMTDKGKPTLEVRIGGIYALDRIAADSPDPYRDIVAEVLTAYVRYHAQWGPMKPSTTAELPIGVIEQNSALDLQEGPRFDIQVVLTILGKPCYTELDLRRTNLQGAHLNEADLKNARFFSSNLQGARLRDAVLEEADLEKADLREAKLNEAKLDEANLREAKLQGAFLQGAFLRGAYLKRANLTGAYLKEANLTGAYLDRANLGGAEGLLQLQLEQAIGNATTKLPEGLHQPESWFQVEDKQTYGKE